MTKSNTLGVVGSVPIPEVIRNINTFTLGAQSVNPKIKTKVVWVNEWFSPPKETEAATSLINGGADVLFQNTDFARRTANGPGRPASAPSAGTSNMTAFGPKAHLASGRHQLGSVLHQGHQGCPGRHLVGPVSVLVGREGRRHRHGLRV